MVPDARNAGPGAGAPVVPAWVLVAAPLLCLAGLGASAYLTVAHYDRAVVLACPGTGIVNCAAVTSSPQSAILGVPVALLGLIYFLAITPLHLPSAWASKSGGVRSARLFASGVGMAMVLYLVYTEVFRLHAICLWCSVVHVVVLGLFVVTLTASSRLAAAAGP